MDLGVKCGLQLIDRAGELDGHTAAGDLVHRKSLAAQPGGNLCDVLLGRTVLLSKLLWSQKTMEIRGVLVFERRQVLLEQPLLLWRALQHQELSLRAERHRRRTAVELSPGERMHIAAQRDQRGIIHRSRNQRPRRGLRLCRTRHAEANCHQQVEQRAHQAGESRGNHGFPDSAEIRQMPQHRKSGTSA